MNLSDGTARLAAVLSVATRIEPDLIRAVRLAALPGLDVGHESEFWFGDLISSRSPDMVALRPALLPRLRAELAAILTAADRDGPLYRIGDLIAALHADLPPTLRLEEKIAWLAVTKPPGYREAIESALESALRALVDDGREGITDWFLGAVGRLPPEARTTRSGWLLGMVAGQRYPELLPAPGTVPPTLTPGDLARIGARLPQDRVGLAWDGEELVLSGEAGPGQAAMPVPATDPRLLDVLTGETERAVLVTVDGTTRIPAADGRVRLRTPLGETYEVSPAGLDFARQAAEELPPEPLAAARQLVPVTEILAAMAATGPAEEFGILLAPETYDHLEPVLPTLVRLLKTSHRADAARRGFSPSPTLVVVFVAAGGVPVGGFRLSAKAMPPPEPEPIGSDPTGEVLAEFQDWLSAPGPPIVPDPMWVLRSLLDAAVQRKNGRELPNQYLVRIGDGAQGYAEPIRRRLTEALSQWALRQEWFYPEGTSPSVHFLTDDRDPQSVEVRAFFSRAVTEETILQLPGSLQNWPVLEQPAARPGSPEPATTDDRPFPGPAKTAFTRDPSGRGYAVSEVDAFLVRIRVALLGWFTRSLTADEVHAVTFSASADGYDEDEVDNYLDVVEAWLRENEGHADLPGL
jgi:DivIVA domain-containing protein